MKPGLQKTIFTELGTGVTAAATATANIDTLGHDHCSIDVVMGTANVVSNRPTVLKLTESDDTTVTNFTAIVAFTGGTATSTSAGFVIPSADTSNPNIYRFEVDTRARKRYLKLSVSPLTTQSTHMLARLGGACWSETVPVTAANMGAHLLVEG